MDSWGPALCREHFEEIAGWMVESAKLQGMHAYVLLGQHRALIWLAIRRAERDERQKAMPNC